MVSPPLVKGGENIMISNKIIQIGKKITKNLSTKPMNIIEFCESSYGLNTRLFPPQKFIFKLFYNLELSEEYFDILEYNKYLDEYVVIPQGIQIRDKFNEVLLHEFNEMEFLEFLYNEKMINISPDNYLDMEMEFQEILFFIGRRGTKTSMTSFITAYTLYLLLLMEDPHDFFEIVQSDEIGIALVSNHSKNSARQFGSLVDMIMPSKFFHPYLGDTVGGKLYIKTKSFLEKENRGETSRRGNISVDTFVASSSTRGASNIIVVMDEFCHFIDADVGSKTKATDELVYEALVPSTSGFISPEGTAYGKSFVMSSPNGKKGKSYQMYLDSFDSLDTLMINVPSHWINSRIPHKVLRKAFNDSEQSFRQEYLAEFIEGGSNWITNANKLYSQINVDNPNVPANINRQFKYFMGLDFALRGDGTAIAIGHYDLKRDHFTPKYPEYKNLLVNDSIYVIDYIEYLQPEEGMDLDFDEVARRINYLCKMYNIREGEYDQWSGSLITQILIKKGLSRLKQKSATQLYNHELATTFKRLLNEGRLSLPDNEEFIDELMGLKETVSKNNLIKVEDVIGHDDRYDAVTRCIQLIYRDLIDNEDNSSTRKEAQSISDRKRKSNTTPLNRPLKTGRTMQVRLRR